jgi:purine-binding chemotaxis protein CheW
MKTPEEYFQEQDFDSLEKSGLQEFSPEEKQFLQKYLGHAEQKILNELKEEVALESQDSGVLRELPQEKNLKGTKHQVRLTDAKIDVEQSLKKSVDVQLVSFFLNEQEYALPVEIVSEVVRYVSPTKLPGTPDYLAGIINLRGRVTPIVRLNRLLNIVHDADEKRFIVVCKHRGLQLGILVDTIATMYRVAQQDIEWGLEVNLGISGEFISGLIKGKEKLIAILSIDRLVGQLID